jgi:hypothetical protein
MIDPMHFDRVDHDDVVKKWYVDGLFYCIVFISFPPLMRLRIHGMFLCKCIVAGVLGQNS